ncbi:MAG: CRISPR-associated protein Cas4 [Candidatus Methanoperedens sp.]|nr:CRISPR-associated protein Cas4 [Candidatus Methanoperedens sp.]
MIRVSDITVYLKCPRMCYFLYKGHDLPKNAPPERILLKELTLAYGSAYNKEDKLSVLNAELDRISNEIRVIYPEELEEVDADKLAVSVSNIRSRLEEICSNLSSTGDFYGYRSVQFEPLLRSEKFGFAGSPDKLIQAGEELLPSIIKTGNIPENGVWRNDRLQLTAYSVLAEEKYGTVVRRGFVEYANWGKVREVTIKRLERRQVLQILDKIKKIQGGSMPEKPHNAPCMNCGFSGICNVKTTLASRFF